MTPAIQFDDPGTSDESSVPLILPSAQAEPPCIVPAVDVAPTPGSAWRQWQWSASSFSVSFLLHVAVILLLGWVLTYAAAPRTTKPVLIQFTAAEAPLPIEEFEVEPVRLENPLLGSEAELPSNSPLFISAAALAVPDVPNIEAPTRNPTPVHSPTPQPSYEVSVTELLRPLGQPTGGGFEGRNPVTRAQLVALHGGTITSESAVSSALRWLAAHQRADGGWRFKLQECPCEGRCANSGTIGTTTGATGLALLPFLGAGHLPHDNGPYADVVAKGLSYLLGRMSNTIHGGDLQEGSMYGHGIATLALCEAYAMTSDDRLKQAAQSAVNFIAYAQHKDGGWRYFPHQPGDTTVFGWQLMALKSAAMTDLQVPSAALERATLYLDQVQANGGAFYGYLKTGKDRTPTAVGLLCRMYLGWSRYDSRLGRGVSFLEKLGPSRTDMYFNYYATQVMHHYQSEQWQDWNKRLRDQLIRTQSQRGHEQGSWYFNDPHALAGGRLYNTAICAMILEVYYRHMPLYRLETVAR